MIILAEPYVALKIPSMRKSNNVSHLGVEWLTIRKLKTIATIRL